MTQPVQATPKGQRVNGVVPRPKPDIEVGYSAHLPFVVPYRNAWEALRDEDITVNQLVAMRKTDGQARALYRLLTLPIRAALRTATFVPQNNVDGGEEEAAWVEQMFTLPAGIGGMTTPFSRVIAQMLMAVFDGFSAFELVYWSPATGPLKGKWTLKKMAHRPSQQLTFLLNDRSEFAGLRQRTMYQGRSVDVTIPAEHAVYYAANEEEKPFYGQSYFQSAFYHWDKKFKLYVIAHLAAQRAAVGTRVGTMPKAPPKEERHRFEKALADLGVAQWMTVPEGWKVESLREAAGFDFLAYINHHNSQMSKSVLAAFFDKEQGGGDSGKLVDFGTQSDALFMMMLQTIMTEIEEVINQHVIPRFIDWNFGTGKYPKFQFGSLTEEQKAALVDMFKTLATAGQALTIRPEFVHELEKQLAEEFGLEIDWETVEAEMAADKEMRLQQQQMAMQAGLDPNAPPGAGGSQQPPAPGGGGAAAGGGHPVVDPSLLPKGFTLSQAGDGLLSLTDEAAGLLAEAYGDVVELVRGKPNNGMPKRVQTAEGARVYGVPIGTPITRDIRERAGQHGVKGKPFGGVRRDSGSAGKATHQTLGGGTGAKAQDLGGVVTEPPDAGIKPKQVLSHPDQPGAQLLDFGDGTVAVRDANGNTSPRQRFQIEQFLRLGWIVSHAPGAGKGGTRPGKARPGQARATAKRNPPEPGKGR